MNTKNKNIILTGDLEFLNHFLKTENYSVFNREISSFFALGQTEKLKKILDDERLYEYIDLNEINPLSFACEKGHLDAIKLAFSYKLKNPINICINSNEPIIKACKYGQLNIVKFLLTSPDITQHAKINDQHDCALTFAFLNKHMDVVNYLILDYKINISKNLNHFIKANPELKTIIDKRVLFNKLQKIPLKKPQTSRLKI